MNFENGSESKKIKKEAHKNKHTQKNWTEKFGMEEKIRLLFKEEKENDLLVSFLISTLFFLLKIQSYKFTIKYKLFV